VGGRGGGGGGGGGGGKGGRGKKKGFLGGKRLPRAAWAGSGGKGNRIARQKRKSSKVKDATAEGKSFQKIVFGGEKVWGGFSVLVMKGRTGTQKKTQK